MAAPTSASFRKYVESSGVSDVLGKALAQLFERHESKKEPENAVEFIRSLLAGEGAAAAGAESKLVQENAALKKEVQSLSESLAKLIEEREKRNASDAAAAAAAAATKQAEEEAARVEAAKQEAERLEFAKQEVTRQEAARQETARQEAARQETARQEAAAAEHLVAENQSVEAVAEGEPQFANFASFEDNKAE